MPSRKAGQKWDGQKRFKFDAQQPRQDDTIFEGGCYYRQRIGKPTRFAVPQFRTSSFGGIANILPFSVFLAIP